MPNTSFSSGFASGAGAITNRNELRLKQEMNQQAQADLFREQAITGVGTTLEEISKAQKQYSTAFYTSKGLNDQKGMAEATAGQERFVKTLWESTEQTLRAVGLPDAQIDIAREKFRMGAALNNPAAEQRLEETEKTRGAVATATGKQPLEIKQIQERGRQARLTRAIPTSNTEIQMTQGGAASQPPGQEPFEGIGTSIMEDIRQSSGAFAAASKAVSRTVGQAVEGTNPRLDAEQRVRNFNQEFKNTLTRNPRYPVKELEAISKNLLPDPSAIITDPESEARKIPLLKQHLENLNEVDARTLQGNLSKKGRNDAIDRMASRQAGIDLIGDVPDISASTEAEIDSLQEKVLADTATEEELNRFIELSK